MASIRLSPDVEQMAQQLSDEMGLGSLRTAVEAVFRTKWQDYRAGGCDCPKTPPSIASASLAPSTNEPLDALAALDSVI